MAALQHGMQEHAGQLGEAGDADLDHRADVGDGQVGELAGGAVARVVDEDLDLLARLLDALEYGARCVGVGEVAGDGQHVDVEPAQLVGLLFQGFLVACDGDQIEVVAGEQQAESLSDAARRAGDQCGLCHDGAPFVPDALRPSGFSVMIGAGGECRSGGCAAVGKVRLARNRAEMARRTLTNRVAPPRGRPPPASGRARRRRGCACRARPGRRP